MNNYEKIKQMTVEEMVEFIRKADCKNACNFYETVDCSCYECSDGIREWLEKECE